MFRNNLSVSEITKLVCGFFVFGILLNSPFAFKAAASVCYLPDGTTKCASLTEEGEDTTLRTKSEEDCSDRFRDHSNCHLCGNGYYKCGDCEAGYILTKDNACVQCKEGEIVWNNTCIPDPCKGYTYDEQSTGYDCEKCTDNRSGNYGKYKCTQNSDSCLKKGYTLTEADISKCEKNGYTRGKQCVLDGKLYKYWEPCTCKGVEKRNINCYDCDKLCETEKGEPLYTCKKKTIPNKGYKFDGDKCAPKTCEDYGRENSAVYTSTRASNKCYEDKIAEELVDGTSCYKEIACVCPVGYATSSGKSTTKCYETTASKTLADGTKCFKETTCVCPSGYATEAGKSTTKCYETTASKTLADGTKCFKEISCTCPTDYPLTAIPDPACYKETALGNGTKCYKKNEPSCGTGQTLEVGENGNCICKDPDDECPSGSSKEKPTSGCYDVNKVSDTLTCYAVRACVCTKSVDGGATDYAKDKPSGCYDTKTLKDDTKCYKSKACPCSEGFSKDKPSGCYDTETLTDKTTCYNARACDCTKTEDGGATGYAKDKPNPACYDEKTLNDKKTKCYKNTKPSCGTGQTLEVGENGKCSCKDPKPDGCPTGWSSTKPNAPCVADKTFGEVVCYTDVTPKCEDNEVLYDCNCVSCEELGYVSAQNKQVGRGYNGVSTVIGTCYEVTDCREGYNDKTRKCSDGQVLDCQDDIPGCCRCIQPNEECRGMDIDEFEAEYNTEGGACFECVEKCEDEDGVDRCPWTRECSSEDDTDCILPIWKFYESEYAYEDGACRKRIDPNECDKKPHLFGPNADIETLKGEYPCHNLLTCETTEGIKKIIEKEPKSDEELNRMGMYWKTVSITDPVTGEPTGKTRKVCMKGDPDCPEGSAWKDPNCWNCMEKCTNKNGIKYYTCVKNVKSGYEIVIEKKSINGEIEISEKCQKKYTAPVSDDEEEEENTGGGSGGGGGGGGGGYNGPLGEGGCHLDDYDMSEEEKSKLTAESPWLVCDECCPDPSHPWGDGEIDTSCKYKCENPFADEGESYSGDNLCDMLECPLGQTCCKGVNGLVTKYSCNNDCKFASVEFEPLCQCWHGDYRLYDASGRPIQPYTPCPDDDVAFLPPCPEQQSDGDDGSND